MREYVDRVGRESAEERGAEDREKTGVPLGRTVVNPVNGEEIPMFVADYVLMEYGTGAIMAVPGHDSRDYDFAQTFDLPVKRVIEGTDPEAPGDAEGLPFSGDGPMVNSGRFDGQGNRDAYAAMVEWLKRGRARRDRGQLPPARLAALAAALLGRADPDRLLRRVRDGAGPRRPAAGRTAGDRGLRAARPEPARRGHRLGARPTCPKCGGAARRETDTMDTFVDSSWYYIRYLDPRNAEAAWDRDAAAHWMPVDQYIGGVEHAILHLMYARFVTKALADLGHLEVQEPFANLFAQGMITRDGAKMSKSRGNTVSPAEYVERYGADTSRTYVCFMGPPERGGDWTDEGVEGVNRFLSRLWRLCDEVVERTAADAWTATATRRAERLGAPTATRGRWSPRRTGRSTRRPRTSNAASSSTP